MVVGEPETIECTACGGIGGLANGNECEVCEGYGSVPVPMALVTYTQYEILQGIDETRHAVEFKDDSWTIIHPLYERANHFLFDCPVNLDYLEEPPAIGRFWIEEDGTLTPMEKGNHARRVNS